MIAIIKKTGECMLLKLILCTSLLLSFNLHAKKADLNSSKLKKNSITFREIKEHKKNINNPCLENYPNLLSLIINQWEYRAPRKLLTEPPQLIFLIS